MTPFVADSDADSAADSAAYSDALFFFDNNLDDGIITRSFKE